MAEEDVERVRRALAAAPADVEPLLDLVHDEAEWDYVGAFPEIRTYHGPDGVREFLTSWASAFEDFGLEAEELRAVGDAVVFRLRQWGRGKETGVPVENRTWQVMRFREGKIVHCRGYESKADALDAARSGG